MSALCRQLVRLSAMRGVNRTLAANVVARRGFADKMMADPVEHATGLEKKEILAMQAGNDDPFNMKVVKKAAGTRESPTLVPSCFDARIVGCICEEHSTAINWLWLHQVGHFTSSGSTPPQVTNGGFDTILDLITRLGPNQKEGYMLHKGHPRRCECGHWYKLIEKQPL